MRAVSPPIRPEGPGWADVAGFVAEVADPVVDLLMWADVASSLGRLADIRLMRAGDRPVALAFAFPLWPERPALGVKGRTPADEAAMVAALVRDGAWRCGYGGGGGGGRGGRGGRPGGGKPKSF